MVNLNDFFAEFEQNCGNLAPFVAILGLSKVEPLTR